MAGEFKITDIPCGQCRRLMVQWGRILFCPRCQAPDGSHKRKYYYAPGPRLPGMPQQRAPLRSTQVPLL